MLISYSLFAALGYSFIPQVLCIPNNLRPRDLNSWVATESVTALQGALNNIGPNGTKVPGAGAGFVVASPSKVNPNCE
jgi:glucoamylase